MILKSMAGEFDLLRINPKGAAEAVPGADLVPGAALRAGQGAVLVGAPGLSPSPAPVADHDQEAPDPEVAHAARIGIAAKAPKSPNLDPSLHRREEVFLNPGVNLLKSPWRTMTNLSHKINAFKKCSLREKCAIKSTSAKLKFIINILLYIVKW